MAADETVDDGYVPFPFLTLCLVVRRDGSSAGRRESIESGKLMNRIILETDAAAIASRVSRPRADTTDIVINEQTVRDACKSTIPLTLHSRPSRY